MLASFAWGFVAASSLILGGVVALRFGIGERALGMVMAFGSGVLISAVSFELVQEALDTAAAGAILTMLADTMMPEAFAHGGKLVGVE